MKKTLTLLIGVMSAMALFANSGLKQLSVTLSTEGPDYYADGQAVQVGETYLLVYVNQGAEFGGVYMDGSLVDTVNNAYVGQSVAISGAKCGFKAFQYPADMFAAGGDFVIVLLDTRLATGTIGGPVAGQGSVVVGQAVSADDTVSTTTLQASGSTSEGQPTLTSSRLPAVADGTPTPTISALSPRDGEVEVRIKNFVSGVNYELQSRTDLTEGAWQPVANATRVNAVQHVLPSGQELGTTVPTSNQDAVRFYRVIIPAVVK